MKGGTFLWIGIIFVGAHILCAFLGWLEAMLLGGGCRQKCLVVLRGLVGS